MNPQSDINDSHALLSEFVPNDERAPFSIRCQEYRQQSANIETLSLELADVAGGEGAEQYGYPLRTIQDGIVRR